MGLGALALGQLALGPAFAGGLPGPGDNVTHSPIKHVIVIIGENRSFDHVFATYVPKKPGEYVDNLLSKGAMPAQPVDATQALNLSAGVSNCKVSRGRSLS